MLGMKCFPWIQTASLRSWWSLEREGMWGGGGGGWDHSCSRTDFLASEDKAREQNAHIPSPRPETEAWSRKQTPEAYTWTTLTKEAPEHMLFSSRFHKMVIQKTVKGAEAGWAVRGMGKVEQLIKHHEETVWKSQWNQTNIPVGVQVTDKHAMHSGVGVSAC